MNNSFQSYKILKSILFLNNKNSRYTITCNKLSPTFITSQKNISTCKTCFKLKTYYDVLKLEQSCSQEEIKAAYFTLSKKFHPDSSTNDTNDETKFIDIVEAYEILGKPGSRSNYDRQLKLYRHGGISTNAPQRNVVYRDDPYIFKDESLYANRDRSQDAKYRNANYYPFTGIKNKVPNWYIAAGAMIFMIVGGVIHTWIVWKSGQKSIAYINLRNRIASEHLQKVRNEAKSNGSDNLEIMRLKLVNTGNNPED